MPIELKNALTEWKKAKPLLLTKTGVSEALRLLPAAAPTSTDAIEKARQSLEKVKKVIDVAVENKHIEKKAHACLVDIQTAIKTEQAKLQKAAEAAKAAAAKAAADAKAAEAKAAQEYAAASKELKQWFGRLLVLFDEWDKYTPKQPRTAAPTGRFTVIHQEISKRLLQLPIPTNHPHASTIAANRRPVSAIIGDCKGGFQQDVENNYMGSDSSAASEERRTKARAAIKAFEALL